MNGNELGEVEAAASAQRAWILAVDAQIRAAVSDGLDYISSPALLKALDRRAKALAHACERNGEQIVFEDLLARAHRDISDALSGL